MVHRQIIGTLSVMHTNCLMIAVFRSSGPPAPDTSKSMRKVVHKWYVLMQQHLQLSYSPKETWDGNSHFVLWTFSSLRNGDTMFFLILVGVASNSLLNKVSHSVWESISAKGFNWAKMLRLMSMTGHTAHSPLVLDNHRIRLQQWLKLPSNISYIRFKYLY